MARTTERQKVKIKGEQAATLASLASLNPSLNGAAHMETFEASRAI
jgi:hypothetical protein